MRSPLSAEGLPVRVGRLRQGIGSRREVVAVLTRVIACAAACLILIDRVEDFARRRGAKMLKMKKWPETINI